jgi:uncharacterized protein
LTFHSSTPADIAGALDYAHRRLSTGLDARYVYHDRYHTFQDVLPAAEYLAQAVGVGAAERDLLRVGAAFHDIGFVEGRDMHEQHGSAIAAEVLARFHFRQDAIAVVNGLIMATRLPQCPRTLLEEIIADADLDVLGRDDFFARNALLFQEAIAFNGDIPPEAWRQDQVRFLESHRYFTQAARDRRDAGKRRNLMILSQLPI